MSQSTQSKITQPKNPLYLGLVELPDQMRNYFAVGLLSAATILLELALLRLFAVQQFYHFAFMAISLALLGAGASGSVLSLRRRRYSPVLMGLFFSLFTIIAYLTINFLPFDSFSIAWDGRQLFFIAGYFLAAAVPFFFSGLVVGGELMSTWKNDDVETPASGSHQIYGASLIGSAIGALITLPIIAWISGEGAVFFAAIMGAVSGLLFLPYKIKDWGRRDQTRYALPALIAIITICLMILFVRPSILDLQLSPYKALSVLSNTIGTKLVLSDWDATARVDVAEGSAIHVMPGLSLASPVGLPVQAGLLIDGDNLMPINGLSPYSEQAQTLAKYLPGSLLFQLRPDAETVVLEVGTGMDVLFALASGASSVTAVEESAQITDVVMKPFGQFTYQLYNRLEVELINQSGRVYARQYGLNRNLGAGDFDLAIFSLTDTHRPVTSGAYSLTEDYHYTVEAFNDYLKFLKSDGLLGVTRWLQTPPSESARTFGSIVASLIEAGINPNDHLIAYRSLRTMTIIASLRPFTAEDINLTRQFLDRLGYDGVYFPGIRPEDLNKYNILEEPVYNILFEQILRDSASTYQDYRFDIRPATDERPFFYHYFKWRQTPEILASLGLTWQPFGGSGYFVLLALLLLVLLASILLILGPLVIGGKAGGLRTPVSVHLWRPRVLIYFACLGLAFLFVEVPLAQQFILLLDQPVIALATVLFSVLLFSGIGSLTVRRWRLPLGMAALILLVGLYPIILTPITEQILGFMDWTRILFTVILLAPLGYLMGLPFAGGLAVVEKYQPALVPWSWAINGSFSVISSVLAVIVAVSFGFSTVLWLGALAYALALLVFYRLM